MCRLIKGVTDEDRPPSASEVTECVMSDGTQSEEEIDWWISRRCGSPHRDATACNQSMSLFCRTRNKPDNMSIEADEISLQVCRMNSQHTVEVAGRVTV